MAIEAESAARLTTLVEAYGRRIAPAVLDQHQAGAIASPLVIWLLLAASAAAASGGVQSDMEEALGCSTAEAIMLLQRFLNRPPMPSPVRWPCGRDVPTSRRCSSIGVCESPKPGGAGSSSFANQGGPERIRSLDGLITKFALRSQEDPDGSSPR